eukprot:scaffold277181_cov39-Attheya_sp.AAC.1
MEGNNRKSRLEIPIRNRRKEHMPKFLLEMIWRHQNKDELWNAFVRAPQNVEYAQDPAYAAEDDSEDE